MFGYVKPVAKELLVKEYEFYKATYCGICRSMKKHTGALSCATITYDSVFLALIRMPFVKDSDISTNMKRCIAHPLKRKCMVVENEALEYTARAFAILSYYKLKDDMNDEAFAKRALVGMARPVLSGARKKAKKQSLEQIAKEKLDAISALEEARCRSVDEPATLFGELLGEIFAFGLEEESRLVYYQCGLHLGKFIYAADAAEDYEKDKKRGRYNPYVELYSGADLTYENRQSIKCALLLECKKLEGAINLMDFGNKITAENIVRNIIYLGLPERIKFLDKEDGADADK